MREPCKPLKITHVSLFYSRQIEPLADPPHVDIGLDRGDEQEDGGDDGNGDEGHLDEESD